jgi:hypothetical protein
MRVNRAFIYAGLFLVAIGGVIVAADLGSVDAATLGDGLRLWPLAIIAIGLGLALRRSRAGLSAGILAAAMPGLLVGSAVAIAPRYAGTCGAHDVPAPVQTQVGTFDGPATIGVVSGCGSLTVGTQPGNAWRLDYGTTTVYAPRVNASPDSLSIDVGGRDEWHVFEGGRDTWQVWVPTDPIESLVIVANASHAQINLPGAQMQALRVTGNASDVHVDLTSTSVATLNARSNAGQLGLELPTAGDVSGTLRADAGALFICGPEDLGLHLQLSGQPREVRVDGLQQSGSVWESPNYATATHHADLDVRVELGYVEINPIGGCK